MSNKDFCKDQINKAIFKIANDLRQTADMVEHIANDHTDDMSYKVQVIQSKVLWGLANLQLDNLAYKLADYCLAINDIEE